MTRQIQQERRRMAKVIRKINRTRSLAGLSERDKDIAEKYINFERIREAEPTESQTKSGRICRTPDYIVGRKYTPGSGIARVRGRDRTIMGRY